MPEPTADNQLTNQGADRDGVEDGAPIAHTARRAARHGPLRRLLGLATWLFGGCSVLALVIFGLGPLTGTYRTLTVLSGSMRPTFAPGDVVIATKKLPRDVKKGDIIVFKEPIGQHAVTSHRVVRILKGGDLPEVVTKGDANNGPDAFNLQLQGNELWYVRGHVPLFGYLIHALRTPIMRYLAFFCIAVLALTSLRSIWSTDDDEEEAAHAAT